MTFTVNVIIYNTKKDYFLEKNPDKTDASTNEIFRFCYHNVKEFRDYKRAFYRERYRQKLTITCDNISNIKQIQQSKIPMKIIK